MAEYIEREAALKTLCEEGCCEYDQNAPCGCNEWLAISAIPAADVAPVVRCRECKWWDDSLCTNINGAFCVVENGDWFCASGERKGDDATD